MTDVQASTKEVYDNVVALTTRCPGPNVIIVFEHATHDGVVSVLHVVSYLCGFSCLHCVCVFSLPRSLAASLPRSLAISLISLLVFHAQSIHFFAPSLSAGSFLVLLLSRSITLYIHRSPAPGPSLSPPSLSRLSYHSQLSSSLTRTFFCFKVCRFRTTCTFALSLILSRSDSPLALNTHI